MKGSIHTQATHRFDGQDMNVSFDKDFFLNSKYVLCAMGIASLYCLGYAVMLVHEFKKMGILTIVLDLV